ncbi:MAG: N-6 DNA methylase [candidate division WOR-3 bacterium]|jgi:type I restriction-modification system DNA methylase subunit|nr:N-6 DNA methylase [candidate division WOR-3 bacterium]MDH7518384.1 N-6 DNA methylase [bacterium]
MAKKPLQNTNHDSLLQLADSLVSGTQNLLREVKTEEDLRIGFEKLLEPIKNELNLKSTPKYEKSVYSGRSDAVHGQVIIEYEPPRSFSSKKNVDHAYEQLVNYLSDEAKETKLTQLVGVGFDGEQIFFVQYQDKNGEKINKAKFFRRGPYDFTPESARTFLIHLRALSRLPLTAENLAQKFGPQSELAPKIVSALANALKYWGDQTHIRTFFNEWKRLFGIVYGGQFTSGHQGKEAETLSKLYKVGRETDFQELLFSVHTYFAFLMKLIAAELLTLRETSFGSSLASQLAHIPDDELKRQLEDIESGGIYARKGITNFLEGDFFRWYLDTFESPELKDAIREIARALSEFEPATSTLDPVSTRDLLKKLYQYLVPQEVRHRLGEYYTPDWLAELLLNEVGYDGNTLKRFLDPACGSGTFLVLAIQRAIRHGREEEGIPDLEIVKRIITNIWGFDLNPLAVIAARTNYLFALGDLVNELPRVEIPIYLTDSILTPTRTTGNLFGEFLEVSTSVGKFQVPAEWVRDGGFLLARAASLVEEMAKNRYSIDEAMARFKKEGLVFSTNEEIVKNFYNQILELEKQNKNGIWARFLKNTFAPMVAGKFDYVVGNPPWIRWEYLSREYREATKNLWDLYGLSIIKESKDILSKGKKDFSMLFTYASADYYLKDGAKLGFLITQEVFKSKGAGEGFRRFQLGDREYLKVLKAHDLVSIQPFEGAMNKTAAIILKKGEKTEYPLPYVLWSKKKGTGKIATDRLLDEVSKLVYRKRMLAKPISSEVSAWQNFETEGDFSKISGSNYYRAKIGARTEPYSIFWLKITTLTNDKNLLVKNIIEGRRKKQIDEKEAKIESRFIYPSFRGADVNRWSSQLTIYTLVLNDPANPNRPFPENNMKLEYPLTYSYLVHFKADLLEREAYKKFHQKAGRPFYTQFNISKDTFMNYKVVWKRMSNDIFACVLSQIKTPFGFKMAIPLDTTSFFPTNNESEAHYLCAIINSNPVRDFIKSFSSAGRGFGTPSVMEHVGIPKFDPKNPLHQKLSEISKKCHRLKAEGKEREVEKLEKENDELVKKLFKIK